MAENQRVGILDKSRKFSVGTSINNPNNGICYVCKLMSRLYKVPNMARRMCFDCKADFKEYAKETRSRSMTNSDLTNAIIDFMLTQPTEEQIEDFYINQVMPTDKRSISEILLDNVLGIARLSGMITVERSEETFDYELVECTSEDGYLLLRPIASTNAYLMDILNRGFDGQMSFDIQELTVRITTDGMAYLTDASTGDTFTLQIAS